MTNISNAKRKQTSFRLSRIERQEAIVGVLFITPFIILYLIFNFLPILQGFWISLHNWDVIGTNITFIGLRNYEILFQKDKLFWSSLEHTIFFALLAGPGLIVTGLALALMLNQRVRGIGIFRTIFYMPNILSVTVVGLVFARVFAPGERGFVNAVMSSIDLRPVPWFLDQASAMPTIAITKVWWSVGFNMLIFLAGLQEIPQALYDAAGVDGGGRWPLFRHITLPGLRRPMLFVIVLQVIASVQVFPLIDVLTGGGPAGITRPLVMYLFERSFDYWQLGLWLGDSLCHVHFSLYGSISQLWFFSRGEGD